MAVGWLGVQSSFIGAAVVLTFLETFLTFLFPSSLSQARLPRCSIQHALPYLARCRLFHWGFENFESLENMHCIDTPFGFQVCRSDLFRPASINCPFTICLVILTTRRPNNLSPLHDVENGLAISDCAKLYAITHTTKHSDFRFVSWSTG